MKRPMRSKRSVVAGICVIVAVAVGLVAAVRPGPAQLHLTAEFATAPGLYDGNSVDVLGMPVGKITGVHPGPRFVTVTMVVPHDFKVPAGALAVIAAPNVVNDRYVSLTPVWTSGPTLADHSTIPVTRTASPISVDQIIGSLDSLSKALGPNGANAHGALSALVANLARTFGNNGPAVGTAIRNLGQGLGALSSSGPDLTSLIDNLGTLTASASTYTANYTTFAQDLATVTTYLSSDDASLGSALSNLQQALGQLATFVQTNSATLGGSIANLRTFAGAVAADQQQLAAVYATVPTALQNVSAAFDPSAPGGPVLKARLDPVAGSQALASSVCGSPLLRLLLLVPTVSTTPEGASGTDDLACGVNGLLAALPVPPGSTGPNLTVGAFVKSSR